MKSLMLFLLCLSCVGGQNQGTQKQTENWASHYSSKRDSTYIELAESSGGIPFMLEKSEIAKGFLHARWKPANDHALVLRLRGVLAGEERVETVLIDSTVNSIFLCVFMDNKGEIQLRNPRGEDINPTHANAQITDCINGKILIVDQPAVGEWQLRIRGKGWFYVAIDAKSQIEFDSFDPVELRGRDAAHQGYFPVEFPSSGSCKVIADLTGPYQTAVFELRSIDGRISRAIDLKKGVENVAEDKFFGEMVMPPGPFRVYVTGLDRNQRRYQRTLSSGCIEITNR